MRENEDADAVHLMYVAKLVLNDIFRFFRNLLTASQTTKRLCHPHWRVSLV
jgi:hypothetical protein